MNSYETHIKSIEGSTFAIGDHAKATGSHGPNYRQNIAEALKEIIKSTNGYTGSTVDEVRDLALDASHELGRKKPRKEVFQRLVDATRKMMDTLGPKIVQAGDLADAVGKIDSMFRHL